MHGTRISGSIHTTVTLGQDGVTSPLIITATGTVAPTDGATGIVVPAAFADARIANAGTVLGGMGAAGTYNAGGTGIDFAGAGSLRNTGFIAGGQGSKDGNGGAGILFAGSRLVNDGTIAGGDGKGGKPFGETGGSGGAAMVVYNTASITNDGSIGGGGGTFGFILAGSGGAGIDLQAGGALVNHGQISGGRSGTYEYSYSAVRPAAAMGIRPAVGGEPANGAAAITAGGTTSIVNFGRILGGAGRGIGSYGGNGILLTDGSVTNFGLIRSGDGGQDAAVGLADGSVTNHGTLLGGTGARGTYFYRVGAQGGDGVRVAGSGSVLNTGLINAGLGGESDYFARAGAGGIGIELDGAGTVVNTGTVVGGHGGNRGSSEYRAGYGGAGVALASGGTLVNRGTITGGAGGQDTGGSDGGAGVFINGGRLIDSGAIAGGAGTGTGTAGAAVQFGTADTTVIVLAGASFAGTVAADPGADDRLVLADGGAAPWQASGRPSPASPPSPNDQAPCGSCPARWLAQGCCRSAPMRGWNWMAPARCQRSASPTTTRAAGARHWCWISPPP